MAIEIIPNEKKRWSFISLVLFCGLVGTLIWIVLLLVRGLRRGWFFGQKSKFKSGGNRYGTPGAPAYRPINLNPNGGAITGEPTTGFSNLDEL